MKKSIATHELVREWIVEILQAHRAVLEIAIRQRAKFEGWLKFELAAHLEQKQATGEALLDGLEGKDVEMKERRKKIYPASRPYEEGLDKRLRTPEYPIAYLNAILDENDPDLLLLGLRDVARAYGFTQIAESTGLNRESLYKALSKGKNPRIGTVMDVLSAMGCRITLEAAKKAKRKAA